MTQSIISQFFSFLNPAAVTGTGNGQTASFNSNTAINGPEQSFVDLLQKLGISDLGANGIHTGTANNVATINNQDQVSTHDQTSSGILLNSSSFNTPALQTNLQSLTAASTVNTATTAPAQKLLALLQVVSINASNSGQGNTAVAGQIPNAVSETGVATDTATGAALSPAVVQDINDLASILGVEPSTVLSTLQSLAQRLGITPTTGQALTDDHAQQVIGGTSPLIEGENNTTDSQILSSIATMLASFIPAEDANPLPGAVVSPDITSAALPVTSGPESANNSQQTAPVHPQGAAQSPSHAATAPSASADANQAATAATLSGSIGHSSSASQIAQQISDATATNATPREDSAQTGQINTTTQPVAQTAIAQAPQKQSAQAQSRATEDAAIEKTTKKSPSQPSSNAEQSQAQNKPASGNPNPAATSADGKAKPPAVPTLVDSLMNTLANANDISTENLDSAEIPGITQAGTTNASSLTTGAHASAAQRASTLPYAAYVSSQIGIQISRAVEAGNNSFNIRLDPAELGRVDVKLEIGHDGRVNAVIGVDNEKTLQLLQREHGSLERALQDAGLKTDSGSLNFSLNSQNDGSQTADQDHKNGTRPAVSVINDQDKAMANAVRMTISDRALDIRV